MKTWFIGLAIGGIIAAAAHTGWQVAGIHDRAHEEFAQELYGTVQNLEVIQQAESATAIRMLAETEPVKDPYAMPGQPVRRRKIDPYDMRTYKAGASRVLDKAQQATLRRLLGRPDIAALSKGKRSCLPDYGVRFRFQREHAAKAAEIVDVNVCLGCALMITTVDDVTVGGGAFDPAEAEMIRLAKELFPDDAEIQEVE